MHPCFDAFDKARGAWPIAESIRNMIPMWQFYNLVICVTIKVPDHTQWTKWISHDFRDFYGMPLWSNCLFPTSWVAESWNRSSGCLSQVGRDSGEPLESEASDGKSRIFQTQRWGTKCTITHRRTSETNHQIEFSFGAARPILPWPGAYQLSRRWAGDRSPHEQFTLERLSWADLPRAKMGATQSSHWRRWRKKSMSSITIFASIFHS